MDGVVVIRIRRKDCNKKKTIVGFDVRKISGFVCWFRKEGKYSV